MAEREWIFEVSSRMHGWRAAQEAEEEIEIAAGHSKSEKVEAERAKDDSVSARPRTRQNLIES
jgi:hypothetical protein